MFPALLLLRIAKQGELRSAVVNISRGGRHVEALLNLGDPPLDGAEPFDNAQVCPLNLTQPFLIRLREIVESSQKLGFGVVDRLK